MHFPGFYPRGAFYPRGSFQLPAVTVNGAVAASGAVTGSNLRLDVPLIGSYDTFPATPTDALCYARFLGVTPVALSAVDIGLFMGTTAAVLGGGGYAEVGFGTGAFPNDSTIPVDATITPVAFTSIATEIAAVTNAQILTRVTGSAAAGSGIWGLFVVNAATTDPQLRFDLNATHFGVQQSRAATRISTNLAAALAFGGPASGGSTATPILYSRLVAA